MSSFTDALDWLRKRKNGATEKPDNRSDEKVAASVYESAMNKLHPGFLAKKRAANILMGVSMGLNLALTGYIIKTHVVDHKEEEQSFADMLGERFAIGMVIALASLLAGLSIGLDNGRSKSEIHEAEIIQEASNLIVELKRKFPNMPMAATTEQIQRLWDVLPDVIRHINPKDRAKLESLARKKDRIPDETYFQQVSEIVSRHLGENSADLETVLNAYRGIITLNAAKQYWARGKSFEPVR